MELYRYIKHDWTAVRECTMNVSRLFLVAEHNDNMLGCNFF
jgi:hypothetical protein